MAKSQKGELNVSKLYAEDLCVCVCGGEVWGGVGVWGVCGVCGGVCVWCVCLFTLVTKKYEKITLSSNERHFRNCFTTMKTITFLRRI